MYLEGTLQSVIFHLSSGWTLRSQVDIPRSGLVLESHFTQALPFSNALDRGPCLTPTPWCTGSTTSLKLEAQGCTLEWWWLLWTLTLKVKDLSPIFPLGEKKNPPQNNFTQQNFETNNWHVWYSNILRSITFLALPTKARILCLDSL